MLTGKGKGTCKQNGYPVIAGLWRETRGAPKAAPPSEDRDGLARAVMFTSRFA